MSLNVFNISLNLKHDTKKTGAWVVHILHKFQHDVTLIVSREHELLDARTNLKKIPTSTESGKFKYIIPSNYHYILKIFNLDAVENPFKYIEVPNVQNLNYADVFSMYGASATLTTPNQLIPNSNSFSVSDNTILVPVVSNLYIANKTNLYHLPENINNVSSELYKITKFSQIGDPNTHLLIKAVLGETTTDKVNKLDSYTLLAVDSTTTEEQENTAKTFENKTTVLSDGEIEKYSDVSPVSVSPPKKEIIERTTV